MSMINTQNTFLEPTHLMLYVDIFDKAKRVISGIRVLSL